MDYSRFNDDHGFAGIPHETFNIDELQDPEDLRVSKGDDALVLAYVKAVAALNGLSAQVTRLISTNAIVLPSLIAKESKLEQWVDSAQDELPEWAEWLCNQTD